MAEFESLPPEIKAQTANEKAVWDQLTFDHDVIIEASAGTGKTYTLEQIVLKLVKEKEYDVSEILLVTFTEKAAGELKNRIRKTLEEADKKFLSNFDKAAICTIHSFCKDLLAEYAFEIRKPMRVEVATSEEELICDAVRQALGGDEFRKRFGGAYSEWMQAGGFKTTEDLIDAVVEKMKKRLCKTTEKGETKKPEEICAAIAGALKSLGIASEKELDEKIEPFRGRICNESTFHKMFDPLCKNVSGFLEQSEKAALLWSKLMKPHVGQTTYTLNPNLKQPKTKKERLLVGSLADNIDGWQKLVDALSDVVGIDFKSELLLSLTELATAEYERMKEESSVMTFDDMVLDASRVVHDEREKEKEHERSTLLEAIRKKYRVALVDEFQDTDGRQWDIFSSIFSHEVNKTDGDCKPGFLLVVGDPKQAIYSFRGADIATYLTARRTIEKDDSGKYRKTLDTTWRSTEKMVDAFNDMFGDKSGWFDGMTVQTENGEDAIEYASVKFPKENRDFAEFEEKDHTGRDAVTLLESLDGDIRPNSQNGLGNNAQCLPIFLENAANEIKRLRSLDSAMPVKDKETEEIRNRMRYGDFCILVRKNADADVAKKILGRHGIPYGHYKEAGIYDSAEAEAVLALLDFLGEPSRDGNLAALLLTPFFRVRPEQLEATIAQKPKAFVKTVETWQLLAAKRDWNGLFENILSTSALAQPKAGDFEYDRRWAAIRQIFDKLLAEIGTTATTAAEFAELLRYWRRDDSRAGEGGALRRKESDANRVQIMTMHASKGLEFPVVFVAYGFSSPNDRNDATEEEKRENQQEMRRLLYVAITRAKQKLYLPWSGRAMEQKPANPEPDGKTTTKSKTDKPSAPLWGVGSKGSALRGGFLANGICALFGDAAEATKHTITVALPLAVESAAVPSASEAEQEGHAPEKLKNFPGKALRQNRMRWDSFTSLHKSDANVGATRFAGTAENEFDEEQGETEEESKSTGPNLFPGGTSAGSVFHEIMEALCINDGSPKSPDFGSVGNADLAKLESDADKKNASAFIELIRSKMRQHSMENRVHKDDGGAVVDTTERMLVRMVWHALNAQLRFDESMPFALKDVARKDRRAEMAFAASERELVGGERGAGAFNGAIDLLVRPEGKDGPVYVLDWKTNTLKDYGNESVEDAMAACGYHLQYEIYSLVVHRWLGGGRPNGVAYMFVRGGAKEGRCGVYLRTLEDGWEGEFATDLESALPGPRPAAKTEGGK